MRSLTAKLIIAFVVVTLVAVGILGLMITRATTAEFGQYLQYGNPEIERSKDALSLYYERNAGWTNVQSVVRALSGIEGQRVILTDGNGRVLADSRNYLLGREIDESSGGSPTPIRSGGRVVGVLRMLPDEGWPGPMGGMRGGMGGMMDRLVTGMVNEIAGTSEKRFLAAVNDSLFWAAVTAGAVALGLSLFLARQIISPLRSVTAAAKHIASGDLSQRVQVKSKDEVGQLAEAFNTMANSLAYNEQLRRNLVADVAHELRTPLSVIQGKLEAMLDGVVEASPEQIASVYNETLLLNRLVSDLKELSLAEAGQLHLNCQPVNLDDLMQRAVDRFEQAAREKQISLAAAVTGDVPPVVVDADRVTQAINNLLSNALRYSSSGGSISIQAAVGKAKAEAARGKSHGTRENGAHPPGWQGEGVGASIVVSVRDQGMGISAEELPHVFDRFYRVDRSRARASGGSGIGLAIVKEIVEAHGGLVWAESEPGKGSVFSFSLPLSDANGA